MQIKALQHHLILWPVVTWIVLNPLPTWSHIILTQSFLQGTIAIPIFRGEKYETQRS